MIDFLKKANSNLMCALVGIAVTFSMLGNFLSAAGAIAFQMSMNYTTLIIFVLLFSVVIFALFARLLAYLSFRIVGGIFTRKSGMLYPFPIGYRDYVSTVLAFSLPCFLIGGIVELPTLFIPTLGTVLGAVSSLVTWTFIALNAWYFVKKNGHDYDRRTLAISLSVIPLVIIGFSLIVNIVGVVR